MSDKRLCPVTDWKLVGKKQKKKKSSSLEVEVITEGGDVKLQVVCGQAQLLSISDCDKVGWPAEPSFARL